MYVSKSGKFPARDSRIRIRTGIDPYPRPRTQGPFGRLSSAWDSYFRAALNTATRSEDDNDLDAQARTSSRGRQGRWPSMTQLRKAGDAFWDALAAAREHEWVDRVAQSEIAQLQEGLKIPTDEQLTPLWVLGRFANHGHRLLASFARTETFGLAQQHAERKHRTPVRPIKPKSKRGRPVGQKQDRLGKAVKRMFKDAALEFDKRGRVKVKQLLRDYQTYLPVGVAPETLRGRIRRCPEFEKAKAAFLRTTNRRKA